MDASDNHHKIELNINQEEPKMYSVNDLLEQILPVTTVSLVQPSVTMNPAFNQHSATVSLRSNFDVFEEELNYSTLNQRTIVFPVQEIVCLENAGSTNSAFIQNIINPIQRVFNNTFRNSYQPNLAEFVPDFYLANKQGKIFMIIETKQWNSFMNIEGLTEGNIISTIENGGQFNDVRPLNEDKHQTESLSSYRFRKALNQLKTYLFGMDVEVAYGILSSYLHTYFLILTRQTCTLEVSQVVRYNDHALGRIAKFIQKALTTTIVSTTAKRPILIENFRRDSNIKRRRSPRTSKNDASKQAKEQNPMLQPQVSSGQGQMGKQQPTGEYIIMGEIIGYGRSGPVRRIFDCNGNSYLAKIAGESKGKESSQEEITHELKNEVVIYKILEELQGEIIPQLYFSGYMNSCMYMLAMQELNAVPISKRSHLSSKEKKAIVHALNRIHQKGVLHRDIRQSNILIGSKNDAYFIDFAWSTTCDLKNDFMLEKKELESLLLEL